MPKNSDIIDFLIRAIIEAVGRRTTKNFAVVTIHTIIKKLELKYDFLKNVEINNNIYSEGMDAICINEEIDSVDANDFGEAINDIIDTVTYNLGFAKRLNEDPSYYFVKEITDKIESEFGSLDGEFGINLNLKQLEYLSFKLAAIKTSETIKNSYTVELILKAIIKLLNKKISESEAIKILKTLTKKLEVTYDVLKYIIVNDTANSDGYYTIETKLDIDNVPSAKIVEVFELLIAEVGDLAIWKTEPNFLGVFQSVLGEEGLSDVNKIGINLDHIKSVLRQKENRLITKKTLETLLDLTTKNKSIDYAVEAVDLVIKNVKLKHDILKYITIDGSRYNKGVDSIIIDVEINSVESYELGKALWAVIKKIKEINCDINFIENFKKELGSEFLKKIEDMGVKLGLLEMIR